MNVVLALQVGYRRHIKRLGIHASPLFFGLPAPEGKEFLQESHIMYLFFACILSPSIKTVIVAEEAKKLTKSIDEKKAEDNK